MQFIKQHITGIIIGACIATTAFHVWFLYGLSATTVQNTNNINEIIKIIQSAQKTSSQQ